MSGPATLARPAVAEGNTKPAACPACGSGSTAPFYRVGSIPVHSCILLASREEALRFPKRDLELAFCDDCGFVFNHLFDEEVMRYSTDFEESQHFSGTFNSFANALAADIAQACDARGKTVLEIGCGKGEFLDRFCTVGEATGIGIDPGYRPDPGRRQGDERLSFIVDHFGPDYHDLDADIILCRHTLEHIAPVGSFIADITRMAGRDRDKWIVFETPDFLRVAQEAAFWDIYYEHCSYFTPGTHARVFRRNALDVTRLELAYDDQYIIQYARPRAADGANPAPALDLEDDLAQIRSLVAEFPRHVTAIQDQWRRRIQSAHAEGKTIVLWGGGSKAVSFLTTLGLSEEVRAAVDINPFKQGKFTPGTGHPVVAPETLHEIDPDLVIVMNPVYLTEIRAMLSGMGLTPETIAV